MQKPLGPWFGVHLWKVCVSGGSTVISFVNVFPH